VNIFYIEFYPNRRRNTENTDKILFMFSLNLSSRNSKLFGAITCELFVLNYINRTWKL